ncbi:hypothetical protein [Loigolactobacillus backii]|nr:hypothetical protein [Loigolactobacillus backii]MDA5386653.1 hypothetical protein [Loigolactobacillus backii]MDA5389180.1 hypothetical protein [Loigolactobacillus backii]
MAEKLSKAQKKEMIQKAEEDRAKHPKAKSDISGFETIDKESRKLEKENQ